MPGLLFMYTINLIACRSSLVYWFTHLKPFHINVGVPHFLSTCCSPSLFILVSTILVSESWQLKQYCVHSWCSTDEEYAEIISLYMIKGRTKRSQRLLNMQSSTFLWDLWVLFTLLSGKSEVQNYQWIHIYDNQSIPFRYRSIVDLLSGKLSQSRNARQHTKPISTIAIQWRH